MIGQEIETFATKKLVVLGSPVYMNGKIAQDESRAEVLKHGTVLAYNSNTKKWIPAKANNAMVCGGNIGIYAGEELEASALVAGDVANASIIVSGRDGTEVDSSLLVFEGSTETIDTEFVYAASTVTNIGSTFNMELIKRNIFATGTTLLTKGVSA